MLPNDDAVDADGAVPDPDPDPDVDGTSLTIALHMTILTPARKSVR